MRIQNKTAIDAFCKKNANARKSLDAWVRVVEAVKWKKHAELKSTFPSADLLQDAHYIFNVGGNNVRVSASVFFPTTTVIIMEVLTHAQYDKKKFK